VNTIYQAKSITLAEINRRWLKSDMSEGVEMARTTFYRHKCAIEDIFGIYIECDKKNGNKYYIGNEYVLREDSVQNWMLSTLSVGNMVEESQSLHNRILLEHVPSGGEKLQQVIKAMKESRMVSLTYRRYGSPDNGTYTLAPYDGFLKERPVDGHERLKYYIARRCKEKVPKKASGFLHHLENGRALWGLMTREKMTTKRSESWFGDSGRHFWGT